jgi:translation initiation factor eIF-2B subunit beta
MSQGPNAALNLRAIEVLASKLRRRQVVGSRPAALETLLLLRQVVSKARFSNIEQLVDIIRSVGRRLVQAQPKEHSVGNTVRKVLHHIREEYNTATKGTAVTSSNAFSISKFVSQGQPRRQTTGHHAQSLMKSSSSGAIAPNEPRSLDGDDEDDDEAGTGGTVAAGSGTIPENDGDNPDSFAKSLKPVLMEAIQDVLDELETVYDNVSKNAKDHVHSDEIILTLGMSRTVESFLKAAAHHRNFTVIVAETGPSYSGHEMSESLSSAGISTFLVPDSSIYAVMSRVNKVFVGAHAILANGGAFATTGTLLAATAARQHSTPVVVCAGQFKLTPKWNLYHEYGGLDFGDPGHVLGFEEGDLTDKVDVINPHYDYIAPELIDAFITNDGDHPPSSIYRLIKETYDDEDYDL